jgi:hypothetical protein
MNFKLVNPYIDGTIKTKFYSETPIGAASELWSSLTEHVIGSVPRFVFTIQNMSDDKLHTFEVSENENGEYKFEEVSLVVDKNKLNKFTNNINEYNKQTEAVSHEIKELTNKPSRKRYNDNDDNDDNDDSSSSSDSSSESDSNIFFNTKKNYSYYPYYKKKQAVSVFHYNPRLYKTKILKVSKRPSLANPEVISEIKLPVFTPVIKFKSAPLMAMWI